MIALRVFGLACPLRRFPPGERPKFEDHTKDVLVAADPRTGAPLSSAQMSREPRGGHPIETDPRFDVGLYLLPEAARLTRVPRQTPRNWVTGYHYPRSGGRVKAPPVIHSTARDTPAALSFVDLIEALALSGFREMGVPLQRVRLALEFAADRSESSICSQANGSCRMDSICSGSSKSARTRPRVW